MIKFSIFTLLIIFSFSVVLYPSIVSKPNIIIDSQNNEDNQYNNFTKFLPDSIKDILLLVIGLFVGFLITRKLNRDNFKFSDIAEKYNEIRIILIEDLTNIKNLESDENGKVGDIVVDNIKKTDILIQQLFFYISKRKVKKIAKHYNEYKKPYLNSANANVMLKGLNQLYGDTSRVPSKYSSPKIPNAKEIAIKYLTKLIRELDRV